MADTVALLDANVLYPIALTDLLLSLAEAQLFDPRWSAAIHDEWVRNVLASRSTLPPETIERRRRSMDLAFPGAIVAGYEPLTDSLVLPDPDDRHVLAAAIHGKATEIVTFNLRDFPPERLAAHGLVPTHPDSFVTRLIDDSPAVAVPVLRAVATRWAGRGSPAQRFAKLSMPRTAGMILDDGL